MTDGATPTVGLMWQPDIQARGDLSALADAGLDHVATADHVSFRDGAGRDGLIDAAGMLASSGLPVYVALYLLVLRHPVLVARQLSTLAETAPGRLVLGVGVGGEDRHEVEVCGVDPRTRGRRMDECLTVLRALLAGGPVTHQGRFFDLDAASVRPVPSQPVPLVVGGRSDAAVAAPRGSATAGSASGCRPGGTARWSRGSPTSPPTRVGAMSRGGTD